MPSRFGIIYKIFASFWARLNGNKQVKTGYLSMHVNNAGNLLGSFSSCSQFPAIRALPQPSKCILDVHANIILKFGNIQSKVMSL